jgi:transcriptional regulator with XRE-family HTH domain
MSHIEVFFRMDNIQNKIAARIKELRLSKSLTQEAVAWRSEVDRTFMNHVENSKRNISLRSLEKIVVHGLEVTLKEFFDSKLFS